MNHCPLRWPEADKVIYEAEGVRLSVRQTLDPAALDLLQRTIYGTAGVRYQHTNQAAKVAHLRHPLFFHLWKGPTLIGMYCLDERPVSLAGGSVSAYYGRYLSVNAHYTNHGYGRLLKRIAGMYVQDLTSSPCLFYSFIEEKNVRSLAISVAEGFDCLTTLRTYFFRRYAPIRDRRMARIIPGELSEVRSLWKRTYGAYRLATDAHIGYEGNYFALKEHGRIIAGVQANLVTWRFYAMPGVKGWLLMKLAPLLPVGSRFFNPQRQAFAVLEGLYLEEGQENLLPVLLESVLAELGVYSAMWQIDEIDPVQDLFGQQPMGFFSSFRADVRTQVLIKSFGIDPSWKEPTAPVYVSSFDYS